MMVRLDHSAEIRLSCTRWVALDDALNDLARLDVRKARVIDYADAGINFLLDRGASCARAVGERQPDTYPLGLAALADNGRASGATGEEQLRGSLPNPSRQVILSPSSAEDIRAHGE
jgi:hypothetical protein